MEVEDALILTELVLELLCKTSLPYDKYVTAESHAYKGGCIDMRILIGPFNKPFNPRSIFEN